MEENIERNTSLCQWLTMMAYLYLQQNKNKQAITLAECCLAVWPLSISAKKIMVVAYFKARSYQRALSMMNDLEANHKNYCDSSNLRARLEKIIALEKDNE